MKQKSKVRTALRVGDVVMVIAGGNKVKKPIKGKTGRILEITQSGRVVVEGLNYLTVYTRPRTYGEKAERVKKEGSIDLSNVMYYAEKLGRPVRIGYSLSSEGKKVRGYRNPETKEFVEIEHR